MGLIHVAHEVEMIAEIGVILLLFVIGMELSLKQLAAIRKTVFIGGAAQVGITTSVTLLICLALGFPWEEALFIGFLFSLSSTAVVLKILQDRHEITLPYGRNALGILIFQDIIVVPMMLVAPILAGNADSVMQAVSALLLKSALVIVVTLVGARYLISPFFYQIAKTRNKELFLLATMTVCFAITFLTSEAGLSLALGAFLAGLIISESEYSHQATSTILPFRELFTSFFFISVGMLLDLSFFFANAGNVLLILVVVVLLKSLIAGGAAALLRYPRHTVIRTGLSLFQVGEFAFILSKVGIQNDLLRPEVNQYFLSVSILSMLLTPFLFMYAERISGFLSKKKQPAAGPPPQVEALKNHLIIIGYGINGRNVARAADYAQIPYCILELNPDTVNQEQALGNPIHFGDGASPHLLEALHIHQAAMVVVAIADTEKTKDIVITVRSLSKSVQLLVRTRYVREMEHLLHLGANEVIPEEFETSVEIFARVLRRFLVPVNEMKVLVAAVRQDNYQVLQSKNQQLRTTKPSSLPDFKITAIRITAESSPLLGPSISEIDLRAKFDVFILAIVRDADFLHPISAEAHLQHRDLLYISGSEAGIERLYQALSYARLD